MASGAGVGGAGRLKTEGKGNESISEVRRQKKEVRIFLKNDQHLKKSCNFAARLEKLK